MVMPLEKQKVLAFVPKSNSHGKKDATGAFIPEAKGLIALARAGSRIHHFDNTSDLAARRAEVLAELNRSKDGGFTAIAFFCHGWMDGIQAGFMRAHATRLAQAIHAAVSSTPNAIASDVTIPLYCCSTGKDPQDDPLTAAGTGDDSFADKLRDALCSAGQLDCRVMGHTTAAHTTWNPMVLFMDGMGVATGGVGGYPPVSPKSASWSAWRKALRSTTLRFRMPFMEPAAIHAELSELPVA
jgi:hypothetical protein